MKKARLFGLFLTALVGAGVIAGPAVSSAAAKVVIYDTYKGGKTLVTSGANLEFSTSKVKLMIPVPNTYINCQGGTMKSTYLNSGGSALAGLNAAGTSFLNVNKNEKGSVTPCAESGIYFHRFEAELALNSGGTGTLEMEVEWSRPGWGWSNCTEYGTIPVTWKSGTDKVNLSLSSLEEMGGPSPCLAGGAGINEYFEGQLTVTTNGHPVELRSE